MNHLRTPRLATLVPALLLAALCGAGCGEDAPATMERALFVEAYAQVRARALASPDATIDPEARRAILAELGVTEGDLEAFVEVHGADVAFMRQVWADVETRLDVGDLDAPAADTLAQPGADTPPDTAA